MSEGTIGGMSNATSAPATNPLTSPTIGRVRVGLTLPSFVDDPTVPIAIARDAEAAGVDAVFVFDHLFRQSGDGGRRPALEAVALLGAIAAATTRIHIGALVFRASLRPPASLAAAVATLVRLAPGRVISAIGAGDSESREENETFGVGFGSRADRMAQLEATARAVCDVGAPVWVGGHASPVRAIAAEAADGWNSWGSELEWFRSSAAEASAAATREPFVCSWGGLAVLDTDDDRANAKAERLGARPGTLVGGPDTMAASLRDFAAAGAEWVIVGPVDSRDPANAAILGEQVKPLLG
jgi:alkanesulfonate monooxygenase SsuD/methylene tetrahydromethanopterin reductase-like flavin-dependent oxidoreductase (luciferase family)